MNKFWESARHIVFREGGKEYEAVLKGDDPEQAGSWRVFGNGEEFVPNPEYLFHIVANKRSLRIVG